MQLERQYLTAAKAAQERQANSWGPLREPSAIMVAKVIVKVKAPASSIRTYTGQASALDNSDVI